MCGIAGIVDLSDAPIDPVKVAEMCHAMAHRGPDANGLQALPHAVLGHQRLCILDLSALGNQPMTTADKKLWIVFNGEIYNHKELRRTLEHLGYMYRSKTDTESLLYGFKEWRDELSIHCRGMWALAIWNAEAHTLYLSRDRMGEKPLFYYQQGTRLAFASSLAGLRPALLRYDISPRAVASLLAYQYIPHTESIYDGVKKLPPAHHLIFNQYGVRVAPYWQLDYRDKVDLSLLEAERAIQEILDDAVREQLEADVPVGVFLSGGVDSGYLTALAAQHRPGIVSITMSVPDSPAKDEAARAHQIAVLHNTMHIEVPLRIDCIRDLPALLCTSEPLADSSLIPASAVAQAARRHMKVVLTGDGGDEEFDGYNLARHAMRAAQLRDTARGKFWILLSPLLRYLSQQQLTPILRRLRGVSSGVRLMTAAGIEAWLSARDFAPPSIRRVLYGPDLRALSERQPGSFLIDQTRQSLYKEWWEGVLSQGMRCRLPNDFLFKVDTATMFHSLEARSPFLDFRLVELAARLPYERLLPDEHSKSLLRRLAVKYNPPDVVYGAKRGFSIPVDVYFEGGWGDLLVRLTRDGVAAQLGLLDPHGIYKLRHMHSSRPGHRLDKLLYSILVLEVWLRVFHARTNTPEELGDWLAGSK